jgi:hypothetical protein
VVENSLTHSLFSSWRWHVTQFMDDVETKEALQLYTAAGRSHKSGWRILLLLLLF